MPCGFQHEDAVFLVHLHSHRTAEAPLRLQVDPPSRLHNVRVGVDVGLRPRGGLLRISHQGRDEPAIGGIHLQQVGTPVGDIYVALGVDSHAGRPFQRTYSRYRSLKLQQEVAVAVELLHPLVAPVGHIDRTVGVDCDTPRHVELPVAASVASEPAQVLAVAGEPLHAVVHAVYDDQGAVGIEGNARCAL